MNNVRTYLQADFKVFSDNEQSSSELGSSPAKTAPWPFGYVPSGQSFFTDTPLRHSYHSHRVIVRSGSGRPLNHKFSLLARAMCCTGHNPEPRWRRVVMGAWLDRNYRRSFEPSQLEELQNSGDRETTLKSNLNRVSLCIA